MRAPFTAATIRAASTSFLLLALVAPSLAQNDPATPARPATPVTVTNTPLPVTVQGTLPVSVQGKAAVDATQSGAWNVGITNSGSSPVPVRDVDTTNRFARQLCHDFVTSLPCMNPIGSKCTYNLNGYFVTQ